MADHAGDNDSVTEKITETFNGDDSSSDSDHSKEKNPTVTEKLHGDSSPKSKIYRLFGREKPVHQVFGAGKAADVFLWRDKKATAGVLGVATAVWVLFELIEYHLLTLVGHVLIFGLAVLFLWSHVATFIKKSPPKIPDVVLSDDLVLGVAGAFRIEINRAFFELREIAAGKDIKKFLAVIAGLWFISVLGSWWSFLTLFYISFVLLHTLPLLYEKYEDQVDKLGEKAEAEIKKQYAVLHANVLSKIPGCKDKKQA